jgi:hypothetical protein
MEKSMRQLGLSCYIQIYNNEQVQRLFAQNLDYYPKIFSPVPLHFFS